MADPSLLNKNIADAVSNVGMVIAAVAALGTAAYGLVDVSKVLGGWGPSQSGFSFILQAVSRFKAALDASGVAWQAVLMANWLNGLPKDQQKATAKSLIHLGLLDANADEIAMAGHVEPEALKDALLHLRTGTTLTPADVNVIGRLDASIDATLDAGYERADQRYRNAAKGLAAIVAVLLAIWGGAIIASVGGQNFRQYFFSGSVLTAILVGLISVPLAPIAKDLSSALQAAVKAVQLTRR